MASQPQNVALNVGWTECERGNVWLTNGEGDHYVLIDLDGNSRLEISINQANYNVPKRVVPAEWQRAIGHRTGPRRVQSTRSGDHETNTSEG